ncbi:unnamed protein product [Rotaria sordida]|uniref:G domain-containing protein n=1 Tax=Rotaria sordida TaxID=392033 RepID=A0A819W6T6_9BILA|nr:unnamed protein product [Rotaria sordida]CAF4119635.1 unnamed protein product [Rotaria sordida]
MAQEASTKPRKLFSSQKENVKVFLPTDNTQSFDLSASKPLNRIGSVKSEDDATDDKFSDALQIQEPVDDNHVQLSPHGKELNYEKFDQNCKDIPTTEATNQAKSVTTMPKLYHSILKSKTYCTNQVIMISKVISTIEGVITSNQKHQSSPSSENVSNVEVIQEKLDTRSMVKILVIGETGSGKSTFINYLTNYFRNGTLQNPKIAIPSKYHPHPTENFVHHENDIQNTTQSKTDSCNQYMFVHNSKQYLFLDTPGLADTRGAQQDDKNITSIINAVEGLSGLTTVIIVVNGAVCRLTVNLRNVIARLRGNLPDIVMDNVILVLTNTARHGANFNISSFELNGNVLAC